MSPQHILKNRRKFASYHHRKFDSRGIAEIHAIADQRLGELFPGVTIERVQCSLPSHQRFKWVGLGEVVAVSEVDGEGDYTLNILP